MCTWLHCRQNRSTHGYRGVQVSHHRSHSLLCVSPSAHDNVQPTVRLDNARDLTDAQRQRCILKWLHHLSARELWQDKMTHGVSEYNAGCVTSTHHTQTHIHTYNTHNTHERACGFTSPRSPPRLALLQSLSVLARVAKSAPALICSK